MLQGFYRGRPSEWVRKIGACAPRNGVHAGLRLTDIVLVLQQIFTSNVCYFCGIWLLLLLDALFYLALKIPPWCHCLFAIMGCLSFALIFPNAGRNFRETLWLLYTTLWTSHVAPLANKLRLFRRVLLIYRNSIGLFWIWIQILIYSFANFFLELLLLVIRWPHLGTRATGWSRPLAMLVFCFFEGFGFAFFHRCLGLGYRPVICDYLGQFIIYLCAFKVIWSLNTAYQLVWPLRFRTRILILRSRLRGWIINFQIVFILVKLDAVAKIFWEDDEVIFWQLLQYPFLKN